MRFMVVDDSEAIVKLVRFLLESASHEVEVKHSPLQALRDAARLEPDVILLDLMMPELDGFELCKKLREDPRLSGTKIIILSGKAYDFDKRRARQLGADGYIVKPIDPSTFLDDLNAILASKMELTYWGIRGTLPVPGQGSLRYGGNTSCLSIEVEGEPLLILDAGSGIKKLSDDLMSRRKGRLTAKILITHPHWDHINALPFFVPLYVQGNEIEIMGARHGDMNTYKTISAQMDDIYFPVTIREFGARVFFRDLREESFDIGNFGINTMLLSHPGNCLGYRIAYKGASVCYITDNELFREESPSYNPEYNERLADFVKDTDILVADTTYLDEEYASKVGWGHSCVSEVVNLADRAGVKSLHLFHHDPDQDDDAIDRKLDQAKSLLASMGSPVECVCPAEGSSYLLGMELHPGSH